MSTKTEQEMRVICDVVAELKALKEENAKLKKELKDTQDFLKVRHEHVLQLEQEIEVLQDKSGLGDTDYMLGITRLTL